MKSLGIFLKVPEPGKVKTRLAESTGPEKAAALYARMVQTISKNLVDALSVDEFDVFFFVGNLLSEERFKQEWSHILPEREVNICPQSSGNLGDRLTSAMQTMTHPAVIIGTDCLELSAEDIRTAFERLDSHQLVLGPAVDGGYYLIGTQEFEKRVFEGIDWSTEKVLSQTKAKAKGLSVTELATKNDIDYVTDLPPGWL